MTSNQIALRDVKEKERHNKATEGLTAEQNRFTEEHYIRSDHAQLISAYAAASQADAAQKNAATNAINAVTNQFNAEVARNRADSEIAYNYAMIELEKRRVSTNEFNAETERSKVNHQIWYNQQQVKLTQQELGIKDRQQQMDAWYKYNSLVLNKWDYERNLTDSEVSRAATTINTLGSFIGNLFGAKGALNVGSSNTNPSVKENYNYNFKIDTDSKYKGKLKGVLTNE